MTETVHVIGGGLAGSEAAWQLGNAGIDVVLHEMRGTRSTPVHKTAQLAELVCSNSFRSDDSDHNAVGLLHAEMRAMQSLVMEAAGGARVPAGSALAVDRNIFADAVTERIAAHPRIRVLREEVTEIPPSWKHVIIATGPLTSEGLATFVQHLTGTDQLAFFDAIAPIVHADSVDMSVAWRQSRYDKRADGTLHEAGEGDYLNCPMDKEQYQSFVDALLAGEKTEFRAFERDTPYFEGCMPIEVLAGRGLDTLRYGPMKPVGLRDPRTGRRPWAVVQLRQDNRSGTLLNMVGFQTKLKHGAQKAVFRMIPGLEEARFARLGGIHRNSFIRSPALLDRTLALRSEPRIRFAGQITGCEGYVESAAIGLMAARFAVAEIRGVPLPPPPRETAIGALLSHLTGEAISETFQPMNVNFGLFPSIAGIRKGRERKAALAQRAKDNLRSWLAEYPLPTA